MDGDSRLSPVKRAIVEVLDRDGHVRLVAPVFDWPVTIGRAIDCDVVLDDGHVAAHHATLTDDDEGALTLTVGDTVNGVRVGRRHFPAAERVPLAPGEVFEVGGVRLRVRRASDPIPAERRLTPEIAVAWTTTAVLLLAFTASNFAEHWLNADPGGRLTDYVAPLLGLPIVVAVWAGFWSVGSRLIRHRFDFWRHTQIALGYPLAMSVAGLVLPVAAFALGWPFLSRISPLAIGAIASLMIAAHLTLILPARRRLVLGVMGALLAVSMSLMLFRNYQVHDRWFTQLYVTTLAPPAMRLAPAVPTTRFFEEARALKARVDAHIADEDDEGQMD